MPLPALKPSNLRDETYDGVTYHVRGELGPVLDVEVTSTPVFFEHQLLLWRDTSLAMRQKQLTGEFFRMSGGSPIVVIETVGSGRLGLSRDTSGQVYALHMTQGEAIEVREHQWVGATAGLDLSFRHVQGFSNMQFSGTGFFIDTFTCNVAQGIVWVHGQGDVFEVTLEEGEQFDLEPSAWIYKDKHLRPEPIVQQFPKGVFSGSAQLVLDRFSGPGKIGFQSNYQRRHT